MQLVVCYRNTDTETVEVPDKPISWIVAHLDSGDKVLFWPDEGAGLTKGNRKLLKRLQSGKYIRQGERGIIAWARFHILGWPRNISKQEAERLLERLDISEFANSAQRGDCGSDSKLLRKGGYVISETVPEPPRPSEVEKEGGEK